jgi:hypothetical protein
MRPLIAHCHNSLSRLYGRAGNRRSTDHLTAAMNLFHEMGMRFWFEKAEAEMQALQGVAVRGNHAREQDPSQPTTRH